MNEKLNEIHNLSLVVNGLEHIGFEMKNLRPSYFRIARESHLVLYRSMIEALRGTANHFVVGSPPKRRQYYYQRWGDGWKTIYRVQLEGRKYWRFCNPELCDEPKIGGNAANDEKTKDFLIGFYDALAMVQTECFMGRFVMSKPLLVSDEVMKKMEWLHEEVRNEYEHFIPQSYSAPVSDLLVACEIALSLSEQLLFKSGNVLFYGEKRHTMQSFFHEVLEAVKTAKA
jgi:hypothetical protein